MAHPGVANPNPLRARVDVLPPEAEQLRLPQPGRRRSKDHQPQDRAESIAVDDVIWDHRDHRIELR